jgi:ornithine--oxo-acid transaminase
MQGEAGIIIPPKGWLSGIQKICKRHNVLLICDEIQSGMGRTGKDFAFQHEIDKPDGLILGKALGGGIYPVSAFLARADVMDVFDAGSHGSTFGGNPLAAAIGIEALDIMADEKLSENSAILGRYTLERLEAIDTKLIKEIRGAGLWIGIDIDPNHACARKICEALKLRGLLCKETHETVVRLAPPLTITKEQIDWALEQLVAVLSEMEQSQAA